MINATCRCHEVITEKTPWNSKPPRYPLEPVYRFLINLPKMISGILHIEKLANRGLVIEERWTSGDTWRPLSLSAWADFGI